MKFKKPVKSGLSIIIVGCGKVGNALVRQLSKEGHDITIIDRSREKVMDNKSVRYYGTCGKWSQLQCTDGGRD